MPSVAIIGVGRVGTALVSRLCRAGHTVWAFDVREQRRVAAEQLGARWAPDVERAVADTDFVFTVLPGSPELEDLVVDTSFLQHFGDAAVWIDLTSSSHELSRRCVDLAREHGIAHLGAPLGGGVSAVAEGRAVLYCGGDPDVLAIAKPVLDTFASTVHHVGGAGAGHLTKLLINLLWFGQACLVTEAFLLGKRLGLPPSELQAVLPDSAADSAFIRTYLPRLLAGDYLADFGLDRCVEELAAVQHAAAAAGSPHDITTAVANLHRDALAQFGAIDGELLAAALLEQRAGTRLSEDGLS